MLYIINPIPERVFLRKWAEEQWLRVGGSIYETEASCTCLTAVMKEPQALWDLSTPSGSLGWKALGWKATGHCKNRQKNTPRECLTFPTVSMKRLIKRETASVDYQKRKKNNLATPKSSSSWFPLSRPCLWFSQYHSSWSRQLAPADRSSITAGCQWWLRKVHLGLLLLWIRSILFLI